ncbi:PSD1 and planctomycete cytochrome C domain-containing protein [Pelagicoccus mobilis]|uniref:PSD1 domain-containing protein n=1 Tax=Pelagicoccus mobilis TaxID=415221 RepID=A0A934S2F1_9BACT|nr:PSD1 and planctomycete cytochrome C domain-containing protein [Pelagicoccus mobilis]MBK1878607.1 PSD1 domain-containing protein [Pelagicoccus mobilis]
MQYPRKFLGTLAACLTASATALFAQSPVDYHTQIEPILESRCYRCHGPDKQESNLRLDRRISMLKGGDLGALVLVPGHPEEGELLKRLKSDDLEFRMPREGAPLDPSEIALIEQWVKEGAKWPGQMDAKEEKKTTDLWSLQPIEKSAIPANGSANPIDAFLQEKLSEHDLTPNPAAEPHTLIRRASIVLTGLPAAPERIEKFATDFKANPDQAYQELLDELFASPHYGERWAQHWLDTIRWAETTGYESNEFRKNAWPYRDYVVESFNQDKPYDQFVKEQIAGDTLGNDLGMGLLVAGPHAPASTVGQQPADIKQARFDRLDETIQSVSSSMMGLTFACARCHSHKFDPISIKDYYSMAAVFNDIEYDYRTPDLPAEHPRSAAGQRIMSAIAQERSQFENKQGWVEKWPDHLKVHFPESTTKSIRLNFKPGNFSLDEIQLYASATSTQNLTQQDGIQISSSKKEEHATRPVDYLIDDRLDNFFVWKHKKGESVSTPWVRIDFNDEQTLSRAELSVNRLAHYGWQYMVNKKGETVGGEVPWSFQSIEVLKQDGTWLTVVDAEQIEKNPESQQRIDRLNELALEHDKEAPPPVFIGKLIKPTKMHVMYRGSPTSPRAEVTPMAMEILDGDFGQSSDTPGPERRAAFADWLTAPDNPLTSRVMVNRLWHQVFGTGIVSTPSDFGKAGGTPSHPELIDWLASDLMDNGWSIKYALRQMLSSDAFRRSSAPSEQWSSVDSDTRLLWRFPPRWLEAEVLRDSILLAAGTIDLTPGGLGYHIYQPKLRYDQWKVVDNYGPHTWRRMLYQQRMRRVDDQMFTAFDFPDCAQIQSKRTRSTTPLQALNLMNGNLVVQQAEHLAKRATEEAGPVLDDQLRHMFMLTIGRQPETDELDVTRALANTNGLPSVARTLYNLNEFFYLN